MTQEEKAKAYDEAIKALRSLFAEQAIKHCDRVYIKDITDIFPELKESEDERIRKALLEMVHDTTGDSLWVDYNVHKEDAIAWLEAQGEHANFRNKIQIGDKVTRNRDGMLVNLSQLKRVAKRDEKQGEQKPIEWGEEDNEIYKKIETAINSYYAPFSRDAEKMLEWFKNLKNIILPQNQWKPSEEQMKILNEVLNFAANHENPHWNDYIFGTLHNLIIQLKKLREE